MFYAVLIGLLIVNIVLFTATYKSKSKGRKRR